MTIRGAYGARNNAELAPASGLLAEIVSGPPTGLLIGISAGIIAAFLSSSTASSPGYASFRKRSWKRLSPRRFTEQLAGGLLAGVALGLFAIYKGGNVPGPLGLVVTGSVTRAFGTGLVAGLAGGAVIGVVELLRSPTETDAPTSPSSTFSSDRRLTLIAGLVITGIGSIFSGLLYGLATGLLFGIAAGLATAVIAGIGGAFVGRKLTVRAWPMFIVTIIVLRTTKNAPLGLMKFLEEAYRLGILRRVGAVYQFRHARLQDRLAVIYQDRHKSPRASR